MKESPSNVAIRGSIIACERMPPCGEVFAVPSQPWWHADITSVIGDQSEIIAYIIKILLQHFRHNKEAFVVFKATSLIPVQAIVVCNHAVSRCTSNQAHGKNLCNTFSLQIRAETPDFRSSTFSSIIQVP